jgi:outer membrane autotransporter protein
MQALAVHSDASDEPADAVLDKVLQMNVSQARTSFAQLSGSGLTQLAHVSRTNTSRLMDVVARRAFPDERTNMIDTRADEADLFARDMGTAASGGAAPGSGLWMRSFGTRGEWRASAHAADDAVSAFDWRGGGIALGMDTFVTEDTLVGASLSYTNSIVALNDGLDGRGEIHTPQAMLYVGHRDGNLRLRGVLSYAQNDYQTERNVTAFGDPTPARGNHGARELSGYAETAYSLAASATYDLQPLVGLRYSRLAERAFTEAGAAESLTIAASRVQFVTSDVGVRLTRAFSQHNGALELRAVWSHELADTTPELTARLAGDSRDDAFTVSGNSASRDHLLTGLSFTATVHKSVSLQFDYNADIRGNGQSQQYFAASLRRTW